MDTDTNERHRWSNFTFMSAVHCFLFGVMVAWTPGVVIMAWLLLRSPLERRWLGDVAARCSRTLPSASRLKSPTGL